MSFADLREAAARPAILPEHLTRLQQIADQAVAAEATTHATPSDPRLERLDVELDQLLEAEEGQAPPVALLLAQLQSELHMLKSTCKGYALCQRFLQALEQRPPGPLPILTLGEPGPHTPRVDLQTLPPEHARLVLQVLRDAFGTTLLELGML